MSSSNPKTPRTVPSETPKLVRLSSQFVRLAQFDESPPKLKPMNGEMNPSARAGVGLPTRTAEVAQAMTRARTVDMRASSHSHLRRDHDDTSTGRVVLLETT